MKKLLICSALFMAFNSANAQDLNFNGKYINSKKQTILITNYQKGQSFDYAYKFGANDEWGCMFEGEGTVTLFGDDFFFDGSEINFYDGDIDYPNIKITFYDESTLSLLLSPEWIGMDCASFGESQEESYTTFKK